LDMMAACESVQRFSPFPIVKTINHNERRCQAGLKVLITLFLITKILFFKEKIIMGIK
jgi:hypothetical protein